MYFNKICRLDLTFTGTYYTYVVRKNHLIRNMMKKVSKFKPQKNINVIVNKCENKEFVDQLIQQYLNDTKSAVENIIRMCESVSEMHRAFMNKKISSHDIDYFCLSVGLQKNKSQYRKYICIGNHADQFRSHIEKMPQAISVLYEITTLNS